MTKNLTEQWKNGELEQGWYYVLLFSNEEYITFIDGNWVVDDRLVGADIKEVLAPVPSYKECQRLKEVERKKGKLVNVNYKLKEILYKCREKLDTLDYGCEVWQGELTGFIEEIDNVLGEKKNRSKP